MNIDITRYLINKDVKVSNSDFDMDKMATDVYAGYTKNEDIKPPKDVVKKEDYDKLVKDYAELETNYNNTVKTLDDKNNKIERLSLEKKLNLAGFKAEDYDEVINLRTTFYADEKDDDKAIEGIKTKFKDTYFKSEDKPLFTKAPNEKNIAEDKMKAENSIKVTRSTSINDLILKK